MRTVPLGDLIHAAGRKAGGDTDSPVYSVTKHAGFVPSLEYFNKQVFSRNLESYKLVEPGDFAYSTIHLDEGAIGVAPRRALISPMYTTFRVDQARVDSSFLLRFLKSPSVVARYAQLGRGAVHRRKAISLASLGTIGVPLPPLQEQRRIAAILDHADTLRVQRRTLLERLDDLNRSVFREMFGLPTEAREVVALGDVADLVAGKSLVADDADMQTPFRVLKISAVTSGVFRASESKPLPVGYAPPDSHLVRSGDLLMSRANTTDLVGATAYVHDAPDNLALPDKIWRFEWRDRSSEPLFFQALLGDPVVRRKISRLASGTGGSMKNVSKSKLAAMTVPRVDTSMQQEFVKRARTVRRRVHGAERAAVLHDELFASLQSRAFRGEL